MHATAQEFLGRDALATTLQYEIAKNENDSGVGNARSAREENSMNKVKVNEQHDLV